MNKEKQLQTDFSQRVVVVTGAGQGIGQAIAEIFAAHGAFVVVVDLHLARAQQVSEAIVRQHGLAQALQVDLADDAAIASLIEQVLQAQGRIDVLVHNAAYFPLTPFVDISPAILQRTLAVNLNALFWLSQAVVPVFRAQGKGRILVTSSVTGPRVAYPGLAHYAASKAGVNGFIRAAALELAKDQITVNGVEPGMIETPASSNLGDAQHHATLQQSIPLGRLGTAQDIAAAMLFLASDSAAYITGQTIIVDGGALLPEAKL